MMLYDDNDDDDGDDDVDNTDDDDESDNYDTDGDVEYISQASPLYNISSNYASFPLIFQLFIPIYPIIYM